MSASAQLHSERVMIYFLPPALALRTRLTMVASSIKKARVMLFVRETSSELPDEREMSIVEKAIR